MNSAIRIFTWTVLTAAALLARDHTDVITMKNGDRLTGEIKGLDGGVLRLDLDYVDGALSLQWLKVARVESRQLFIVLTQDGSVFTGAVSTARDEANKIEVIGMSETPTVIEQARVVKMEETSIAFLRRWSGQISLGVVYSKGNNATQYNLGGDAEYQRERWGAQVVLSSNLSANSGSETSTRNQVTLTGYRLLPWRNYFYGGLVDFLQSSVQDIHLQSSVGGGIGRYLKNTSRSRISILGGLAWQSANYTSSDSAVQTQQVAAGLLATNVKIFVFKKTNLSLSAYLIPAINDAGRVHFSTNTSYYWKIFGDLSWNLSFYGNWDTRPPANFAKSDYGYSSGLKWTFGYR
jgi:hypothetical protein